jgi:DNA-binding PucR family transcriptional regulator
MEATGEVLSQATAALLWTIRHGSLVAAVPAAGLDYRTELRRWLAGSLGDGRLLAFGIGDRAEGAPETRHSYAEAVDALRIGPRLEAAAPPVYDYQELAPLAALLADPGRARRLIAETLEPLGELRRREWALPTLEAYLLHQGRLKSVAAALGVHQNTVKYRMNELRPALGPALDRGDRAAQLLLTLRLERLLAPEAVRPVAPMATRRVVGATGPGRGR